MVMSVDKKFKSKALDTDDKFSFTFQLPGRTSISVRFIRR